MINYYITECSAYSLDIHLPVYQPFEFNKSAVITIVTVIIADERACARESRFALSKICRMFPRQGYTPRLYFAEQSITVNSP